MKSFGSKLSVGSSFIYYPFCYSCPLLLMYSTKPRWRQNAFNMPAAVRGHSPLRRRSPHHGCLLQNSNLGGRTLYINCRETYSTIIFVNTLLITTVSGITVYIYIILYIYFYRIRFQISGIFTTSVAVSMPYSVDFIFNWVH